MRLLALLGGGFGASGGAAYDRDLLAALSQSAAVSDIIVLPRFAAAPALAAPPAKVRQLAHGPGGIRWCGRAVALAARRRFDAVLCGHLAAVPLAAAIARMKRLPLWVQVHGADAWRAPGRVQARALGSAALVTSASRHARARLLAWADLPPHRARVLPGVGGPLEEEGDRAADALSAGGDQAPAAAAVEGLAFARFSAQVDTLVRGLAS